MGRGRWKTREERTYSHNQIREIERKRDVESRRKRAETNTERNEGKKRQQKTKGPFLYPLLSKETAAQIAEDSFPASRLQSAF